MAGSNSKKKTQQVPVETQYNPGKPSKIPVKPDETH